MSRRHSSVHVLAPVNTDTQGCRQVMHHTGRAAGCHIVVAAACTDGPACTVLHARSCTVLHAWSCVAVCGSQKPQCTGAAGQDRTGPQAAHLLRYVQLGVILPGSSLLPVVCCHCPDLGQALLYNSTSLQGHNTPTPTHRLQQRVMRSPVGADSFGAAAGRTRSSQHREVW